MVKVFVISQDEARYQRTLSELAKMGISQEDIYRFDGVDGKSNRSDDAVTPLCKLLCTNKLIGCGLAHIRLAKHIVQSHYPDEYFLIVEDDIKAIDPVLEYPKDTNWDIMLLYCQGNCTTYKYNDFNRFLTGSTAAYFLSRSGAEKIAESRLLYHIDHQRNSLKFKIIKGNPSFSTFDTDKKPIVFGQSIYFWMKQDIVRLFGKDLTLTNWFLALFTMICICSQMGRLGIELIMFIIAMQLAFIFYTNVEFEYHRTSKTQNLIYILFPLMVLLTNSFILIRFLAYYVICFNGIHRFITHQ